MSSMNESNRNALLEFIRSEIASIRFVNCILLDNIEENDEFVKICYQATLHRAIEKGFITN